MCKWSSINLLKFTYLTDNLPTLPSSIFHKSLHSSWLQTGKLESRWQTHFIKLCMEKPHTQFDRTDQRNNLRYLLSPLIIVIKICISYQLKRVGWRRDGQSACWADQVDVDKNSYAVSALSLRRSLIGGKRIAVLECVQVASSSLCTILTELVLLACPAGARIATKKVPLRRTVRQGHMWGLIAVNVSPAGAFRCNYLLITILYKIVVDAVLGCPSLRLMWLHSFGYCAAVNTLFAWNWWNVE